MELKEQISEICSLMMSVFKREDMKGDGGSILDLEEGSLGGLGGECDYRNSKCKCHQDFVLGPWPLYLRNRRVLMVEIGQRGVTKQIKSSFRVWSKFPTSGAGTLVQQ